MINFLCSKFSLTYLVTAVSLSQAMRIVYMSECNVLMFILFVGYKHCCRCFMLNKYI